MYKVQKIAAELKCDTDDLLAVMNAESGLDAQAQNISGRGAVGLIQFTDVAVEELNRHGCNVTKEQLKNMDAGAGDADAAEEENPADGCDGETVEE